MIKDYAKHRPKFIAKRHNRYQSTRSFSAGLPSWAWVLFGLVFGIILSSCLFWKLSPSKTVSALPLTGSLNGDSLLSSKEWISTKDKKPKSPKKVTAQRVELAPLKQAKSPESRFDFYTLLPTMSVDPLASEALCASKKSILPYILQAGSFKTHEQAEQLKSLLALQGLQAHIQTVKINPSESWYRVYIGPFNTKADALEAQQILENGHMPGDRMNSVILKMRVS